MRVRLETLGCRLNEAEAQVWAGEFRQRGCRIADDGEKAELVVVNTCAVTGEAARKSRQLLRRVRRRQPQARVVASGCYASLEPAAAAAAGRTDLLLPNAGKERLVPAALALFDAMTPVPPALPETAVPRRRPRRSRAFVKIQDGCRHRCSYCIVTVARGAERSRPAAETVAEVRRLVAGGVLEVVLTGVHTAGYGAERGGRLDTLVRAILQDTDLPRLRLGSLEPWDLPEDFFRLFEAPRLMPHLHLPLQSGSDKILKRMARRVRTRDYERLAAQARAAHPDIGAARHGGGAHGTHGAGNGEEGAQPRIASAGLSSAPGLPAPLPESRVAGTVGGGGDNRARRTAPGGDDLRRLHSQLPACAAREPTGAGPPHPCGAHDRYRRGRFNPGRRPGRRQPPRRVGTPPSPGAALPPRSGPVRAGSRPE